MPINRCVINFARGLWYPQGQLRLFASLRATGYSGSAIFANNEASIGAPSLEDCPYGFKPYALQKAYHAEFTHVLWCDASVWAIRNIEPMFEHIDRHGHMFFNNTWTGTWTSDACLKQFSVTRDEAMHIPMLMGICMGFNLAHPRTRTFFSTWMRAANDGISFPGNWTNKNKEVSSDPRVLGHRHDQSVASLIAWNLGMELITPHETYFEYYTHPHPTPENRGAFDGDLSLVKPHTVMLAQGL